MTLFWRNHPAIKHSVKTIHYEQTFSFKGESQARESSHPNKLLFQLCFTVLRFKLALIILWNISLTFWNAFMEIIVRDEIQFIHACTDGRLVSYRCKSSAPSRERRSEGSVKGTEHD